MSNVNAEAVAKELAAINTDYETHFAGQPRATREVARMDILLRRIDAVLTQLSAIPEANPEIAAMREDADARKVSYSSERIAILDAQKLGTAGAEFSIYSSNANLVFARYQRHFAGQNRATRDASLLAEMLEDLRVIESKMRTMQAKKPSDTFVRDIDVVMANSQNYKAELAAIQTTFDELSQDDKANAFAAQANGQFAYYATHFAGKARDTRRPGLLQRMVESCKRIHAGMTGLTTAGYISEQNETNASIVASNLKMYEAELAEIRKLRQSTGISDIMGRLGVSANEDFELYQKNFAGKNRREVPFEMLGQICDRLGEVLRQQSDLARAEDNSGNNRNMEIVRSQLEMYENEWDAVRTVQAEVQKPS